VAGITLGASRLTGENVGTYATSATATGGNIGNYSVTFVPGVFTITAKTATVTAPTTGKTYGALDPALVATQSGFLVGDVAGITLGATRAVGENVGTYATTATATGGNAGNYKVTYVRGGYTISAKVASGVALTTG